MPSISYKILAVCLGNICRSPIAHGLLNHHASRLNLNIEVDSAGTINHHSGNPPDSRSIAKMKENNIDISGQRSRVFCREDFDRFDLILAMDKQNLMDLQSLARNDDERNKVKLVLGDADVPDPYYGGEEGFENVFHLLNRSIPNWLELANTQH
ncbi:MAG: low molecular weight protein-tyrosine-phosphatase [Flavobacteriales bacterium]